MKSEGGGGGGVFKTVYRDGLARNDLPDGVHGVRTSTACSTVMGLVTMMAMLIIRIINSREREGQNGCEVSEVSVRFR